MQLNWKSSKIICSNKNQVILFSFFLVSLLILIINFYLYRHFMTSMDEYDNLSSAFLMTRGYKLYNDMFNMHFPLPFFWAGLFSPLWAGIQNISRSITLYRLSLLFLYIICFSIIFYINKNKLSKIGVSLWIIIVSWLIPLYHGNLFLSDTFVFIFLSSLFWIYLPIILDWEKVNKQKIFLAVMFSSACVWTQPLLIVVWILPLLFLNNLDHIKIFVKTNLINLVLILFMVIRGQWKDFWIQTIVFNSKIYSNFFPEQVGNLSMFQQNLKIFPGHMYELLTNFYTSTEIYQFFLTLFTIVFLVKLIVLKKIKFIIVFLILFLSTRVREIKIIPGHIFNFAFFPYLSLGLISLLTLILNELKKITKIAYGIVLVVVICMVAIDYYPIFRQSLKKGYNYEVFWSWRQRMGEDIKLLTKEDEKILVYPYDSDLYFLSQREPVDRFLYWYPWIDKFKDFKDERIKGLSMSKPRLIYYGNMSYKGDSNLYQTFFPNLLDGYSRININEKDTDYWMN